MTATDRFLAAAGSWDAFFKRATALPAAAPRNAPDKGRVFERLTQLYLRTHPEYQTRLKHVWRVRDELPSAVRARIGLPRADEGIDLVAETFEGELWAIQCKFRTQTRQPLTVAELATFANLSFNVCRNIALAVVAHTCAKPVRKSALLPRTTEIGLERWLDLDAEDWKRIRAATTRTPPPPAPRKPRPHQQRAVDAAKAHFLGKRASRGRLLMPCGTGKSLTAFWIAEALKARSILVAVPSLSLIKQSLTDWTREFLAHGEVPEWLCVCGDESTGRLEQDEFVGGVYELGVDATTDPKEIGEFLARRTRKRKVVFATYQSGRPLAAAARGRRFAFDLGIMDEAHRTVGSPDKSFGHLLLDRNIPVAKRLFMTATERVVRGADDTVLSMDDPAVYGECFHQLTFKEAIEAKPPIIADYKVLTITVSDERVRKLIEERRHLRTADAELGEREAQALAAGIALQRAFREEGVRHAISFHRSIRAAEEFREQQERIEAGPRKRDRPACYHVSSRKTAGERTDLLREFRESPSALITNARCLQEGVDIPAVDCVLFADPKQSVVDIVQAAGRAMRPNKGKKYGWIVVPIVVPSGMEFAEFAETTEFKQVARVVTALSTQDDRIAEEFRGVKGKGSRRAGERIVEIKGDVPLAMNIDLDEFREQVRLKLWERVGRVNWRPFEEARDFARGLRLKGASEWAEYSRGKLRNRAHLPADVPKAPSQVYAGRGWRNWADWLDTSRMRGGFWEFGRARNFVRGLQLERVGNWPRYCKGLLPNVAEKPREIPSAPNTVYEKDWVSWSDWLGIEETPAWRSYAAAQKFAKMLGLRNYKEWRAYADGRMPGKPSLPRNIPKAPDRAYSGRGWTNRGWGDFLGTGTIAPGKIRYREFPAARLYARSLKLKSHEEWKRFTKGLIPGRPKFPSDIPMAPDVRYKSQGWKSWPDWLGTERNWLPFAQARDFARSLGLRSLGEWHLCLSGGLRDKARFPSTIPRAPNAVYANSGWKGWGHFLGTNRRSPGRTKDFLSFLEARRHVRELKLANAHEWREWSAGRMRHKGLRPTYIPSCPQTHYRSKGWQGWGDWLGTGNIRPGGLQYLPFAEARTIVRSLGLKSQREWFLWRRGRMPDRGKVPEGMPTNVSHVYKASGWLNWGDFLGAGGR